MTTHQATSSGRVPPHDLDAESAVLSAVLTSNDGLERVAELLKPERFYSDANGAIFEAALALATTGTPVDIVTVATWLRDRGRLAKVGGPSYLAQISDATPARAHLEAHARLVTDKWRLRTLIAVCHKVTGEGYGPIGDTAEFLAGAEAAIMSATTSEEGNDTPTLGEAIVERIDSILAGRAAAGGIGTGLDDVDRQLGPMLPANFIVLGAHSGVGKTSLGMQIAVHVEKTWTMDLASGKPMPSTVLACSMEMSRAELADRAALAALGIDTSKAARGLLDDADKAKLSHLRNKILERGAFNNLILDDRGSLTPAQIRAAARRAAVRGKRAGAPLRLVIIDYLQLCNGTSGGRNHERREREVSYVAEQMKALAKELNVVVLALAQLNEDARTADRLPRGEDLRESKSIRAHADKVILMHNESALARRTATSDAGTSELRPEIVDIIVDKNRGVPEGSVCVTFWPSTSGFADCSPLDAREHRAVRAQRDEDSRSNRRSR